MPRAVPPDLRRFLGVFPRQVQSTALALRARVLDAMPRFHEVVWDATNAVSLVYSPTQKWQDGVVHIATYSGHVNLGFNDGATLADPLGLLAGTGKRIRHVAFRATDEVAAGWIPEYLAAALAEAGLDDGEGDGGTTVRVSSGPKRRPD